MDGTNHPSVQKALGWWKELNLATVRLIRNETIGETGLRDFVVWDEEYEDLNDAPWHANIC
jgi:hypothetical protein